MWQRLHSSILWYRHSLKSDLFIYLFFSWEKCSCLIQAQPPSVWPLLIEWLKSWLLMYIWVEHILGCSGFIHIFGSVRCFLVYETAFQWLWDVGFSTGQNIGFLYLLLRWIWKWYLGWESIFNVISPTAYLGGLRGDVGPLMLMPVHFACQHVGSI